VKGETMTHAELLEVVYRFYPRGLSPWGLGYEDTEESYRQREAAGRGAAEYPRWKAMITRLRARYSSTDHSLRLLGGGIDPGYSGDIGIPGRKLGFHVSLLGPYYGIRLTGDPGEPPAARDLAQEIEATFPGYAPIPPSQGDEVVPDVSLDGRWFGETTIYECLLAQAWRWSSEPWPPPPVSPEKRAEEKAALEAVRVRLRERERLGLPVARPDFEAEERAAARPPSRRPARPDPHGRT